MRLSQAWIVATKEFATFSKKKNIIYSVFIVPLVVSVAFPAIIWYAQHRGRAAIASPAELVLLLPTFSFFFLILAGFTPATIASYSLVGEKLEKSLEPLLATPTTDGEILFGKWLAAFVPPMGAILVGSAVYMGLMDAFTHAALGYYYYPNWNAAVLLFLEVPLAVVMSVEWNVFVSSRVSDVRIAQQVGALLILPFAGIYVGGEMGLVTLGDVSTSMYIAGALAIIDLLLLYVVGETFQRDLILTKWK
ncbi:MAG: ABC transporter permease subunit [Nitrososphaerota archaeon]|jgi:ABC-type Na+ efflux pump permease subunit|nr:ABC transporter permease subunit [Nitrososphaerota archaeon]MDG6956239.1 ABC transporter permease subunit [Nitrososphaerota archaeon]MDG6957602.1 ABC transporter permease subunit [Nitrososphaerota archaeon]MDG6959749.1 ABC transporter permease subunit [Nitrososphaerota archaeon]MDG6968167.1 ABC transporter permease subunit [Nitrososphaerota archaeon]